MVETQSEPATDGRERKYLMKRFMRRLYKTFFGKPVLPIGWLGRILFYPTLNAGGSLLNLARLVTSRHLVDLQWAALVDVVAMIEIAHHVELHHDPAKGDWFTADAGLASVLLTIAAGILGWIYQAGNRRLGTIDLFAAEISTICRSWIVLDFARLMVRRAEATYKQAGAHDEAAPAPADSERAAGSGIRRRAAKDARPSEIHTNDDYTPVHDHQLADLVQFDVEVVSRVTEFYTYRKIMIDYLLNLSSQSDPGRIGYFHCQIVYMLFLACEAGRKATNELIEFEPNEAESKINILCSEISAYQYLLTAFHDYRKSRLELRRVEYRDIIIRLALDIHPTSRHWDRARTTFSELWGRYEELCDTHGDTPPLPPPPAWMPLRLSPTPTRG